MPLAGELDSANRLFTTLLTKAKIKAIAALLPAEWLSDESFHSAEAHREAYVQFLENRIENADFFVNEARHARESII